MKRGSQVRISSTASYGAFLHWTSHYLQSPLSATSGYIDLAADPDMSAQHRHMLAQAQLGLVRSQEVLDSIVALHKYLDRQARNLRPDQPSSVEYVVAQVRRFSDVKFELSRANKIPLVSLEEASLVDGILLLVRALKTISPLKRVKLKVRQMHTELVLHANFGKKHVGCSDILIALCRLDPNRYPLLPGEHSALAAAFVLLRASGCKLVVRPAAPKSLDMYLHISLVRQLSLVDILSDLG